MSFIFIRTNGFFAPLLSFHFGVGPTSCRPESELGSSICHCDESMTIIVYTKVDDPVLCSAPVLCSVSFQCSALFLSSALLHSFPVLCFSFPVLCSIPFQCCTSTALFLSCTLLCSFRVLCSIPFQCSTLFLSSALLHFFPVLCSVPFQCSALHSFPVLCSVHQAVEVSEQIKDVIVISCVLASQL